MDDSLHRHSFQTGKMREVRGGTGGMKIKLDGGYSEKDEDEEGHPGTDSGPLCYEEKCPKSEQDEEGNPSSIKERKVELAEINTNRINEENRNERKAESSIHLQPRRISLLIILEPPATAGPDRPLHKPG